ncbi:beta/alpha barrel domain-containing protein [Lignipirellula cremea]|uniref:Dihydroorotate dehydrogenase B (NAD(+)), catalytic subunit n=1 Tax=Lignipirellula cremea TaxID=2528010 RepID=A0A518DUI1_9BACT|nr:hypothetical protein [Lignipirellula cremea]QDU95495.1 Dihydroorotate dehydrogenase B (NAD(+)), catalytic subunit [Lignipirellula cremea]
MELPRYDRRETYAWNYEQAPAPLSLAEAPVPGDWRFCGRPAASPLGVAAGPLLNGRWCLYYASLGFDVLTYKTVRSVARDCYPLPNLAPVAVQQMHGGETSVATSAAMHGSWAVSFGMPSQAPEVWRRDVEQTKAQLPPGKLLSVSVVGSIEPGWSREQLADDYAQCAAWAAESGADLVEMNFSCPNVSTCDGQLYQQPADAALVAAAARKRVGSLPLAVKIGHLPDKATAAALLRALAPHIDAVAMTNSLASTVRDGDRLLFNGQPRGICGDAIRTASLAQVACCRRICDEDALALQLIGVGGASTAEHVQAYLQAGANAVHLATAAMVEPQVALHIRKQWQASAG